MFWICSQPQGVRDIWTQIHGLYMAAYRCSSGAISSSGVYLRQELQETTRITGKIELLTCHVEVSDARQELSRVRTHFTIGHVTSRRPTIRCSAALSYLLQRGDRKIQRTKNN